MGLFKNKKNVQITTVEPIKQPNVNHDMSEQDYQILLKKIMELVPIDKRDNMEHILTIFNAVYSLMYGDDIRQYTASTSIEKEYVCKALSEITATVQEHSIQGFKEVLDSAREQLALIEAKKDEINASYIDIETKNNELNQENNRLLLANQATQAKIESAQSELQKLQSEIQSLQKIKNSFSTQVTWLPLTEDDPIYGLSYHKINDYINSTIKIYARELNVSIDEAREVITFNSPGLISLSNALSYLDYGYRKYNLKTIKEELHNLKTREKENYYFIDSEKRAAIRDLQVVIDCLSEIRIPHFSKVKNNLHPEINKPSTVPNIILSRIPKEEHLHAEVQDLHRK